MSDLLPTKVGTVNGIDIYNLTGSNKLSDIIRYSFMGSIDYSSVGGGPFTSAFGYDARSGELNRVTSVQYSYGADPGNFAQADTSVGADGVMHIRVSAGLLSLAGRRAFAYAVIHEPYHLDSRIDDKVRDIINGLDLPYYGNTSDPNNAYKSGIAWSVIEELVLRDTIRSLEVANPSMKNFIGSFANWPGIDALINDYASKPNTNQFNVSVSLSMEERAYLKAALKSMEAERFGLSDRCFPAHTRIQTSRTTSTAISDLRVGDIVMAFDPRADNGRGALVPKRVKRLYRNTTTEWIRLRWFDGEERELITTPGHHFLDQFGQFPTIAEMVRNGRTTVVLASGALAEVTAERITYSADTAHMFERATAMGMVACNKSSAIGTISTRTATIPSIEVQEPIPFDRLHRIDALIDSERFSNFFALPSLSASRLLSMIKKKICQIVVPSWCRDFADFRYKFKEWLRLLYVKRQSVPFSIQLAFPILILSTMPAWTSGDPVSVVLPIFIENIFATQTYPAGEMNRVALADTGNRNEIPSRKFNINRLMGLRWINPNADQSIFNCGDFVAVSYYDYLIWNGGDTSGDSFLYWGKPAHATAAPNPIFLFTYPIVISVAALDVVGLLEKVYDPNEEKFKDQAVRGAREILPDYSAVYNSLVDGRDILLTSQRSCNGFSIFTFEVR